MSPKASEVVCSVAEKYHDLNRRNDFLPCELKYTVVNKLITCNELCMKVLCSKIEQMEYIEYS